MKFRGSAVCMCVSAQKHTRRALTAGEFSSLTLRGWLEYADMFLYHFHEPPPRHPRVLSLFYISLTTNTPPTLLSETSTWTATDTNTPLRQLYLLPQWKAKLVTTHPKLTEALLILPPVVVDTGCMSLHINYVSQQGMQGKKCASLCDPARTYAMFVCVHVLFFFFPWKNMWMCLFV